MTDGVRRADVDAAAEREEVDPGTARERVHEAAHGQDAEIERTTAGDGSEDAAAHA